MSSSEKSVEDVQDSFDLLILSIFESVRSHADPSNESNQKIKEIKENYEIVKQNINHLKGSNVSTIDQTNKFKELNERYTSVRSDILSLELQLHNRLKNLDSELSLVSTRMIYDMICCTLFLTS